MGDDLLYPGATIIKGQSLLPLMSYILRHNPTGIRDSGKSQYIDIHPKYQNIHQLQVSSVEYNVEESTGSSKTAVKLVRRTSDCSEPVLKMPIMAYSAPGH